MLWTPICLVVLAFVASNCNASSAKRNRLNDFISHYEGLDYDKNELHDRHLRFRRSITHEQQPLHLDFYSHKRHFRLRVKRDTTIFSEDFQIPSGDHSFHPSNIYEGHLEDDTGSKVHGFVHDRIFEGRVYTSGGEEFHIEPAWKYFNDTTSFHSVIYNVANIRYPFASRCGAKKNIAEWMKTVQRSAIEKNENKNQEDEHHERKRRATGGTKSSCRLFVQADPTFTEKFAKSVDRALYLMSQHVKSVDHIYKETAFTGFSMRVRFAISRMLANTTSSCGSCPFKEENIGVAKFLELNSETNHQKHCLAYVFAYRDFSDGVLGLAWIGEKSGASGGVCERWKMYSGGKYKSLNTGIVTTLNYNQAVPSKVTDITLAHEIGHNFGAQHDPSASTSTCSPGSTGGGNYIMYPSATSGSDANNYKFSKCSKDYIGPVLQAKSHICFEEHAGPICGNKIVEAGEECDCGYDGDDCKDACCIGQGKAGSTGCRYSALANSSAVGGTRCSPSEGPCCTTACKLRNATDMHNCSSATQCAMSGICDGTSAYCPTPLYQPDITTECNSGKRVCINGSCIGSICVKHNKTACMCTSKADFCKICCMTGNDQSTCKSMNLDQSPGTPCDNYLGYCDIFDKCRKVDAEGPLSRLKNSLFRFIWCCSKHTPSSNPNKPPARQLTLPRTLSRRPRPQNQQPVRASAPHHSGGSVDPWGEGPPGYDTAIRDSGRGHAQRMQLHHKSVRGT
eukprot:gene19475-21398_t